MQMDASYAWKSFFPFEKIMAAGAASENPLYFMEPRTLQLLDRVVVWLECYFRHKGYALPPTPQGTCAELFLLVCQFQIVHGMVYDRLENPTRLLKDVGVEFGMRCPPPAEEADDDLAVESSEATMRHALTKKRKRCAQRSMDWDPLHVATSVYRDIKNELRCVEDLRHVPDRWQRSAARR